MLKNIAESVSNLTKLTLSAAQLTLMLGILGGGWWAYSAITAFLSQPIRLPEVQVKLPTIGLPGVPDAGEVVSKMDWKDVHFMDDARWDAFAKLGEATRQHEREKKQIAETGLPFEVVEQGLEICKHEPRCTEITAHHSKASKEDFGRCAHEPKCRNELEHYLKPYNDAMKRHGLSQ